MYQVLCEDSCAHDLVGVLRGICRRWGPVDEVHGDEVHVGDVCDVDEIGWSWCGDDASDVGDVCVIDLVRDVGHVGDVCDVDGVDVNEVDVDDVGGVENVRDVV